MQPTFLWWIGDTYAGNYGPLRSLTLLPLKTLADRHILWSSGSDFPVTPVAARYGLWAAIERKPLKGLYGAQPFGTLESIDIHTALKSYTRWSAPQLFLDHEIGSLEPGKRADLAVWSQDPYSMAAGLLKDLHCEMTVLDGAVVYRAPGTMLTEITVP
jgi:predicted amidohydrolase YtcJ